LKATLNDAFYYSYGKVRSHVQPYISTNFQINEVTENLYIGDFASACNREELKNMGFTHILTAIMGVDAIFPSDFTYKTISVCDQTQASIHTHFDEAADFIYGAINAGGRVYVHCMAGISRSSTLICAYLIKYLNYTDEEAIELLKKSRDCTNPNEGFRKQLQAYHQQMKLAQSHEIEHITEASE
jgi:predicted protein tyrosine phosphatase